MSRVLVIGDLHISDNYVGYHKDYWGNCVDVCGKITRIIEEKKITHLILTGDIIGMKEKNLRQRDSLLMVMMLFQKWNSLTNNNVYSVIGNHDMGGKLTDFNMLEALGVIKTTNSITHADDDIAYIDIEGLRIHLIDYGAEHKNVVIGNSANAAITHADIQVNGQTTWWYPSDITYELSTMRNWKGIEMIVAGHIHNPSPRMVSTTIDGTNIDLFYVGNPTRPKRSDTWGNSWGMIFDIDKNDVNCEVVEIPLAPVSEIFTSVISEYKDDIKDEDIDRVAELAEILSVLSTYKLDSADDIEDQIKRFSGVDTEAMELALKYYDNALNSP